MRLSIAMLAGGALLISTEASAAPTISGVYLYQSEEVCPAGLTVSRSSGSTGNITNIVTNPQGDVTTDALLITFTPGAGTPNAGKLTGSGFQDELTGLLRGLGQTLQSDDKAVNVSGTYSNTANSVTISGGEGPHADHVVYGTVKLGIVQTAVFTSLKSETMGSPSTTVTCVEHGSLIHQ